MQEDLKTELDVILGEISQNYCKNERYILTESDLVNETYSCIRQSGILRKYGLSMHTEIRPYEPKKDKVIRNKDWEKLEQINYAAKFDLVLVDDDEKYWKITRTRIAQAQTGTDSKLKYWRFLLYPVESFRAVIEFKVRVKGNRKNIRKDIKKMKALHIKNNECLKYLVILDRVAPKISVNSILDELKEEDYIQKVIVN